MLKPDPTDPIVVTGMGVVSPLGVGVATNWQRLLAGESGIVPNTRFDVTDFACKIAGLVPTKAEDPEGFDPLVAVDPKEIKKMDLFIQYGLVAAQEAIAQSGWAPQTEDEKQATATIIASGVGGSPLLVESAYTVEHKGPRRLSPFTVPAFLANLAAGWISIHYGFKGPIGTPVTACAASAQAIGDGMRLILTGEADVAVVGGAEGSVDPVSIGGFAAARALNTSFNDDPRGASRPFDARRAGFVLAEGAAVLVIEKLSHARARGAKPLATLAGYGTSADAYHLTSGEPTGAGAQIAMRKAIEMAGISSNDIGYVNAHATSTEVGDAAEIAGIAAVFGERGKSLAVSSTKSSTGHLLGAAGGIEAIISVTALTNDTLPATLNLEDPDPTAAIFDLVPKTPKSKSLDYVLSNAFGFGGVNATLVFGKV
ncbi:beta-ketoacyl-ACP synthase II [Devosia nitrariae]|uniref:3-oxoacyl-[acyl-carrier-protein] synthase 2 n=1 Tax=Devosia nitrariae TaxID=2071872 RepID=A0ABQ5WCZ3_9HYPH|nr:beta-ketoacyl-ACP synthase II [Devosia nitrariae]GLQ57370.1 3-oxoacyl-[acyl-carrier-protein] synthase 2 [Devosia nitrariae]